MKYLLKFLPLMMLFFLACEKKNASQNTDNQLSGEEVQEIQKLEKANEELETTKQTIEAKTENLDGLLNEIDQ